MNKDIISTKSIMSVSSFKILKDCNPILLINELLEVHRDVKTCTEIKKQNKMK